jgi:hypothetical protein
MTTRHLPAPAAAPAGASHQRTIRIRVTRLTPLYVPRAPAPRPRADVSAARPAGPAGSATPLGPLPPNPPRVPSDAARAGRAPAAAVYASPRTLPARSVRCSPRKPSARRRPTSPPLPVPSRATLPTRGAVRICLLSIPRVALRRGPRGRAASRRRPGPGTSPRWVPSRGSPCASGRKRGRRRAPLLSPSPLARAQGLVGWACRARPGRWKGGLPQRRRGAGSTCTCQTPAAGPVRARLGRPAKRMLVEPREGGWSMGVLLHRIRGLGVGGKGE